MIFYGDFVCVCVVLVGATVSSAVVTVESSLRWRAFTGAAAAHLQLSALGIQVEPDSHKQRSLISLTACHC